jgi:hypothetical protein|tara:strand:- start:1283 stop:1918 length:636 start_codon:yes stop_codon:yes gene_type:complete
MNNKDLIHQYVGSTGQRISKYQFDKLSNNQMNSYLKSRAQAGKENPMVDYELFKLNTISPEQTITYVNTLRRTAIFNLLSNTSNPTLMLDILGDKGIDAISKLDSVGLVTLVQNTKDHILLQTVIKYNKILPRLIKVVKDRVNNFTPTLASAYNQSEYRDMHVNSVLNVFKDDIYNHLYILKKISPLMDNKDVKYIVNSDLFKELLRAKIL